MHLSVNPLLFKGKRMVGVITTVQVYTHGSSRALLRCYWQWRRHMGMGTFTPKVFSCSPVFPQIISNVLKLAQISHFQHKNGKLCELCEHFVHFCPFVLPLFAPFQNFYAGATTGYGRSRQKPNKILIKPFIVLCFIRVTACIFSGCVVIWRGCAEITNKIKLLSVTWCSISFYRNLSSTVDVLHIVPQVPYRGIRRRSDYIIGFIAPAIGPNKSKKLTRLIAPVHNIHGKVWMIKTYMVSQTDSYRLWSHVCRFYHSNFVAFIVFRRYKPCEFLWFVWTDCWGNKSHNVITSPANRGCWRSAPKWPK